MAISRKKAFFHRFLTLVLKLAYFTWLLQIADSNETTGPALCVCCLCLRSYDLLVG